MPPPPSTSQVSLPSQIGAMLFIITSRSARLRANGNKMPTPRSNPSSSTYMNTLKAMMPLQIRGRSSTGPPSPYSAGAAAGGAPAAAARCRPSCSGTSSCSLGPSRTARQA